MTLTVTTPSLGVRIWPEADGRVRIGFATEGGRGVPRAALALPVQRDGDAWRCPPGLLDTLRREGSAFWLGARSGWRCALDPQRGPSNAIVDSHTLVAVDPSLPHCERFGPFAWSDWDGAHVMLLLVYPQLPSVGGDAPTRAGSADDEAAALASFFHVAARELRLARRGLVRLPAADASTEVTIALSSCQYPADLLDGSPRRLLPPPGPADASLLRLHSRLQGEGAPSLLVLTGDQVYVDATAGLFDTRRADDRYRVPYQNLLASAGAQAVFGLVPTAMVLDDHEIDNNWEPVPGAPRPDPAAIDAYWRFQRLAGPPRRGDALWCELVHRGLPLFLADTRTERSPRDALRVGAARMMSDAQRDALFAFLRRCRGRPCVVVSSAMLLPRHLAVVDDPLCALACDGWDGYPASLHELLARICDEELGPVVFASGDEHLSCVVEATVRRGDRRSTLWSLHSSALYAPYPFANGRREDFVADESFAFGHGHTCEVQVRRWEPGDGFALLTIGADGARVEFDRAGRATEPLTIRF